MTDFFLKKKSRLFFITFILFEILVLDFVGARILGNIRNRTAQNSRLIQLIKENPEANTHRRLPYGHEYFPFTDQTKVYFKYPYRLITNSLGFRDASPRKVEPRAGRHRVLFIGDSFIDGSGVEHPETVAGLLKPRFDALNIDLLNAGVGGYACVHYYCKIRYLLEVEKIFFDEVVVFMDLSDILDSEYFKLFKSNNDFGEQVERIIPQDALNRMANSLPIDSDRLKKLLKTNSLFFNLVAYIKSKILHYQYHHDHSMRWTHDKQTFDRIGHRGLYTSFVYMSKLAHLLKKRKIPLTLVIFPRKPQIFAQNSDSIHVRYWRKWAEHHGYGFINLFPAFIKLGDRPQEVSSYFLNDDPHWNAKGSRFAAEEFWDLYRGIGADSQSPRP